MQVSFDHFCIIYTQFPIYECGVTLVNLIRESRTDQAYRVGSLKMLNCNVISD